MNFIFYHRLTLLLCLTQGLIVYGQSKESYAFIYGGFNKGAYVNHQSPIAYRAWEFNNFVGVTKQMKPNKSFSGVNFGAVVDLSLGRINSFGIPLGIEYSATNNKCSGSRDSATAHIEKSLSEHVRAFYVGMGICTPAVRQSGTVARLQIGYIPYFSLAKLRVDDKNYINGIEQPKQGTLKGTYFSIKHLVFVRYRLTEKFTLGFFPYYEGHFIDGAAQITYNDPSTFTSYHELYKLNNLGASLCAVLSF